MSLFQKQYPPEIAKRVPPGQRLVKTWPVLHYGPIPSFDGVNWDLEISGLVENPFTLSYQELRALPTVTVDADMHCVTGWSQLDNAWEGVSFRTLREPPPGWRRRGRPCLLRASLGEPAAPTGRFVLLGPSGRGGLHADRIPLGCPEEFGLAMAQVRQLHQRTRRLEVVNEVTSLARPTDACPIVENRTRLSLGLVADVCR